MTLSVGSSVEFQIPGVDENLIFELSKPESRKGTDFTIYRDAIVEPIFYTQKEHYKLSDTIFEKLPQLVPGMINIIACVVNSSTHEQEDLLYAIKSINSLIKKKDDNFFVHKGFKGTSDFLDHTKLLSAVLFKGIWFSTSQPPNLLWCNARAECQIPNDLQEYLSTLSYISKES